MTMENGAAATTANGSTTPATPAPKRKASPTTRERNKKPAAMLDGTQKPLVLLRRERRTIDEARAKAVLSMTERKEPNLIGFRGRVKKAGADGEPRPTIVGFRAKDGSVRSMELESQQTEMDFVLGIVPTAYRLATEMERTKLDLETRWMKNQLTDEEREIGVQPLTDFLSVPFHQIKMDVTRAEAKKLIGKERAKTELDPDTDEFTLVPTAWDGFRPDLGDRLCVPHGGAGNLQALAAYNIGKQLQHGREVVFRISTIGLKTAREALTPVKAKRKTKKPAGIKTVSKTKAKDKDLDHLILAQVLETEAFQTSLHAMTDTDVIAIALRAAYDKWWDLQAQRKIAAQHHAIRKDAKSFISLGAPVEAEDIDAITDDADPDYVIALEKAEARAKKEMERILLTFPIYRDVLAAVPGLGPSIGARFLVSIVNISRFRKPEYDPNVQIAEISVEIGKRMVALGIKKTPDAPTEAWALEEAQSVKLDDLLEANGEKGKLWHHRQHLTHENAGPKQGKPYTFRLLHVLAWKWEQEKDVRADETTQIIALMRKKEFLQDRLKKVNVAGMRLEKEIGAVQRYLGVFVKDGRFPQRRVGELGGWRPEGRQACHLFNEQALKDCSTKTKTYGPLRKALSIVRFEYSRRHPVQVLSERDGKPFTLYTPKYTLSAAKWQFASALIDWLVRSWEALEAGKTPPPFFATALIKKAEQAYPAELLEIVYAMKCGPAHFTWKAGEPIPPPVVKKNKDGEEIDNDAEEAPIEEGDSSEEDTN